MDNSVEKLSDRELEVMSCIMDDLDIVRTARRLVISTNTVKTHRKSILRKLNRHTMAGAVARWGRMDRQGHAKATQ